MLPPPYGAAAHAVCEALAYLIGARLFVRARAAPPDLPPLTENQRWSVVLGAIAGAALGSKLLYYAEYPAYILAHLRDPAALLGGKTIVGGLLGGLCGVELAKVLAGVRRSTGDGFVPGLLWGMALGRVGCFLAGLHDNTYGAPTRLPLGVDFGDGLRRHPTQLYEVLFLLLLAPLLRRVPRLRGAVAGDRFRVFMAAYLAFRLAVDFLKPPFGPPPPGGVGGPGGTNGPPLPHLYGGALTALQLACVLGLVYYGPAMLRLLRGRPWRR